MGFYTHDFRPIGNIKTTLLSLVFMFVVVCVGHFIFDVLGLSVGQLVLILFGLLVVAGVINYFWYEIKSFLGIKNEPENPWEDIEIHTKEDVRKAFEMLNESSLTEIEKMKEWDKLREKNQRRSYWFYEFRKFK